MIGGSTQDWLMIAVAAVLCPIMVYVAWRAIFSDREQHLRRCPKCRYDMTGSLGLRCSECGHIAREESKLFFRHRRPLVAMGAIIACSGLALVVNEGLRARSWTSLVPTNILIATLPVTIDESGAIPDELVRRVRSNTLDEDHWYSLLSRAAKGDWRREPLTDKWVQSYGKLIIENRGTVPRDSSLGQVIAALPPRVDITTRDVWPVGVPPRLDIDLRNWWPAGYDVRLRARPVVDGATETRFFHLSHAPPDIPFSLSVPALAPSTKSIELEVEVARRPLRQDGNEASWEDVFARTIDVPIKIEGTVADHFDADRREIVESAMRRVFRFGVVKWSGGGPSPVRVWFDLISTFTADMDDMAVGVRVELLYKDQLARRLDLWWLAGSTIQLREDRNYNFDIVYEDVELLLEAEADEHWSMRVTGDAALAVRAGEAKSYWAGSFTQPLIVNHPDRRTPPPGAAAPERPWRIETGPPDDAPPLSSAASAETS